MVWEKQYPTDRSIGTMPTAVTYYNGMIFFGTANSARGSGFALRASEDKPEDKWGGGPGGGDSAGPPVGGRACRARDIEFSKSGWRLATMVD